MSYENLSKEELVERLKNDKEAEAYFWHTFEACKKQEVPHAKQQLREALENIGQAQGTLFKKGQIGHDTVYKLLTNIIISFVE